MCKHFHFLFIYSFYSIGQGKSLPISCGLPFRYKWKLTINWFWHSWVACICQCWNHWRDHNCGRDSGQFHPSTPASCRLFLNVNRRFTGGFWCEHPSMWDGGWWGDGWCLPPRGAAPPWWGSIASVDACVSDQSPPPSSSLPPHDDGSIASVQGRGSSALSAISTAAWPQAANFFLECQWWDQALSVSPCPKWTLCTLILKNLFLIQTS